MTKLPLQLGALIASTTEFMPARIGHAYALVDSRAPDRVRYVGSTWEPRSRLWSHLASTQKRPLPAWMKSVVLEGGSVQMLTLATASDREALYRIEDEQIEAYRAIGMADLNGENTRTAYSRVHRPREVE